MERKFSTLIFTLLFIGIFIMPFFVSAAALEKIFYLAPYNEKKGLTDIENNYKNIDVLAPQYYSVTKSLTLSGKLTPALKTIISEKNLKVMPLVTNAKFSQTIMHQLLNSKKAQVKIINNLVTLAKKDNYIGWQFDFENINYKDKDLFTAFVQRTYPIFKKNNLIFSVAVVPRSVDFEDTNMFFNWEGAYDYKKIAESTDFVSLMTYDDSHSVGPGASMTYVNKILDYMKDKIPAEKTSLGVPLYCWKWSVTDNKKVSQTSYEAAQDILRKFPNKTGFDSNLGASWLTYSEKNKDYKIWLEDKKSFQSRLNIAENSKLRGFSAWVLGGEDPEIWNAVSGNNRIISNGVEVLSNLE